jgi:hypothetical protein
MDGWMDEQNEKKKRKGHISGYEEPRPAIKKILT